MSIRPFTSIGLEAMLSPSRGAVVGLACICAGVSARPMFWGLIPFGVLVLLRAGTKFPSKRASPRFTLVVSAGVWLITLPRGPLSFFSGTRWLPRTSLVVALSAAVVIGFLFIALGRQPRLPGYGWVIVGAWVVASGAAAIAADPQPWIDVWDLHADAGSALVNGESPYAGRSVPNPMHQFPRGSIYEGYVYPPLPLFTFALTDAVLGDSRWFAVASGLALVWAFRRMSMTSAAEAVAVLFLISPAWPLIVQLAWTEPLSMLLIALAVVARRSTVLGPALMGAFIGSKQYLLITAVPLIAAWLTRKSKALLVAGSVAGIAYAIGLVFGAAAYMDAAFLFLLRVPPPELGANLPGMLRMLFGVTIDIPTVVVSGLGAVAGALLAHRSRSDYSALVAITVTLTVVFMFGFQAFPNYWYLVAGIFVVAILAFNSSAGVPREAETIPAGASDPPVNLFRWTSHGR